MGTPPIAQVKKIDSNRHHRNRGVKIVKSILAFLPQLVAPTQLAFWYIYFQYKVRI